MTKHTLPTFLLAGFGSFPGAPINPSERLMRRIGDEWRDEQLLLSTKVLPVEWDRSWLALEEQIRQIQPSAVLLFGLHAKAERLRIETQAVNERRVDRVDAAGRLAATASIFAEPAIVRASLPLELIRHRLGVAGIEHEVSDDAGRYLCNETLFHLCRSASRLGIGRYGFVHTPLTDDCSAAALPAEAEPSMQRTIRADDLLRSALIMVSCLKDDLRKGVADDRPV